MTESTATRRTRALAPPAAVIALMFGGVNLYVRAWMGFPDGGMTERDRAVEPLLAVQGAVGLGFAVVFVGLAVVRRPWTARALLVSAVAFVLLAGGLVAWEELGLRHLDDGQGG